MASADLADLKPIYLIYGSEELLLERAEKRLRDRLAAVADLDFNMETFNGDSASAADVVNAANTIPFMSDRRLVVVRDVDKFDSGSLDTLIAYAKDPAPFTCLVLVATKVAKNSKLYRAVAAAGVVFEYAAPRRSEYSGEVVKLFRERGKRITPSVAERLVELVGRDLRRLDVEVEKLAAYVGEAPDVSATDLASAATADGTTTVYELTDAVGDRDVERALRLLGSLLGSGETALGLVAMLVRHVRALIGALALAARGLGVDAMAPELGMAPWQARNAARQASKWEPTELSNALRGLAAVEEEMKTSPTDAGLVLERWIISTMRPADSR
jgi:DNA polymerase-3 subunit delta